MDIRSSFGRNFNISREAGKRYERLRQTPLFKGMENKDIFMLAMSLAYRERLERKKIDRYPLLNTTSFTNADLWLIVAIAFDETADLMIIKDANEMKRIAEEYAMAGLPEVERRVTDCDSTDNLVLELNRQGRDALASLQK